MFFPEITLEMQGTLRWWVLALPGRDDRRYTRECWLCTLGVLHPGVPVMWQTHIRDLSPSAEAVRGAAYPR